MAKNFSLFLIFLLAVSFSAKAQETFNVEEALPAKTLLFITETNAKDDVELAKTLGLYRLFTGPELETLRESFKLPADVETKIKDLRQKIEAELETPTPLLRDIILGSGQMGLALVDFIIPTQRFQQPTPILLLSWDLKEKKAEFAQFFDKVRAKIYAKSGKIEETTYQVNNITVTIIQTPMPIFFAYADTTLLISSDKDLLDTMLANPKAQDSLANLEQYKETKQKLLKGNPGELIYANFVGIKELLLKSPKGKNIQDVITALGLDTIHAVGMAASVRNGQVVESLYVHTPNGRAKFVATLFPTYNIEEKLVQFIPNKLLGLSHGMVDMKSLYNESIDFVKAVDPYGAKHMEKGIAQVEEMLGFTIIDALDTLGNEYMSTISCSGGLIPDFGMQISLKNPDKFKELLEKVLAKIPAKYRRDVKWEGHTFTYFNFSTEREPVPVAPTIAVENGRFLFTLFPETAKTLLTQKEGNYPQELIANMEKDVKYVYKEYWNIKSVIVPAYKTFLPLFQATAPLDKVPFELALLPSGDLLEKYLTNLHFFAIHTDKSVLWETYSPTGVVPLIIIGVGVAHKAHRKFGEMKRRH